MSEPLIGDDFADFADFSITAGASLRADSARG